MPDGQFLGRRWPWGELWEGGVFPWQTPPGRGFERPGRPPTPPENIVYLDRLYQILQAQYDQGLLPWETINAIQKQQEDILGIRGAPPVPPDAPFYKQLIKEGEVGAEKYLVEQQRAVTTYKETVAKETATRETAARTYLPQLNAYLQDAVRKGQITQAQLQELLQSSEQQLAQGVTPQNIPNYQSVQDFLKLPFAATPERIAEWAEKRFIATPDMAPKEKQALAEYKRTQALQEKELQNILETQEREKQYWAMGRQQQQAQAIAGGLTAREMPVQQKEQLWGEARQQALARTPEHYGWIKRWELEHMPSPYERSEAEIVTGEVSRTQTELAKWERIEQNYPAMAGVARGAQETARASIAMHQAELAELERVGPPPAEPPRPTALPTPAWLSPLTGLRTGEPIRKDVTMPTPSPQQWMRLLPTQRERYAGFTEWAGGRPMEDIMHEMDIMRPRTPIGAGRTRWQPARQRVSI